MPTIIPILIVVVLALIFLVLIIYSFLFINKKKNTVILGATSKRSKVGKVVDGIDTSNQESVYLAIDKLKKIIKSNPDDFQCRKKLADLYVVVGSLQAAVKEYLTILDRYDKIAPQDEIDILAQLGDIYFQNNQLEEAQKYYQLLKNKDNSNLQANLNLGKIYVKSEQTIKGLELLQAVHKIEPRNAEAVKYMAQASYSLDKFQEACNYYKVLSQIEPLDDESVFYKGVSHYNLCQNADSFDCFERVINNPNYEATSSYYLGNLYRKNNDLTKSNEFFEKALKLNKLRPAMAIEVHYLMADNYINLHNLELALSHWNAIMRVNPKYKDVANKINMYNGVNNNTLMEDYMIGNTDRFVKICNAFVTYYVKKSSTIQGHIHFRKAYKSDEGYTIVVDIQNTSSLETFIFLFVRNSGVTGDVIMRTINNKMKEEKIDKGVCVTCGTFSDSAKEYVALRMIDALDKEATSKILSFLHV